MATFSGRDLSSKFIFISFVTHLSSFVSLNIMAPALALHPRGVCQECAGEHPCAGWVGRGMEVSSYGERQVSLISCLQRREPDLTVIETPSEPVETCVACQHRWIAHHGAFVPPQTSRAFEFIKGVCLPDCGGFYSVSCMLLALSFPLTPPDAPTLGIFLDLCLRQALGGARIPVHDSTRKVCPTPSSHSVEVRAHLLQGPLIDQRTP